MTNSVKGNNSPVPCVLFYRNNKLIHSTDICFMYTSGGGHLLDKDKTDEWRHKTVGTFVKVYNGGSTCPNALSG